VELLKFQKEALPFYEWFKKFGLGSNRMKRICIVGGGAAALLLLYNLETQAVDPSWITIVDPTHTGGDIMKKWFHVRSNTTWQQILEALPSKHSDVAPWSEFDLTQPVELHFIVEYLRLCVKDYMAKTQLRTDTVVSATQENNLWTLQLAHSKQPLIADAVFFCQGSEPKSLDLPFPSIPLDVALDSRRLSDYVKPGQHVLVFGTAHSGPLVVKNLVEVDTRVTNFYATEKPFYFARDGDYDGIKQDAEHIADNILKNVYPNVSIDSVHDMSAIIRASKTGDMCVYACGFEPRLIHLNDLNTCQP
jgi:cation diffusion facilitator CzcD-associated flavoprotein CzcO